MGTASGQRRPDGGDGGRRPGVVDTPGEEDVQVLRVRDIAKPFDLFIPQREAGPWAHVATAFTAFEHESPGTLLHETVQQSGGGHVEIGGNPSLLERAAWVGRPPAMSVNGGRAVGPPPAALPAVRAVRSRECRRPTDGHREVARLAEERLDLGPGHEGEGQERQGPVISYGRGKCRVIAHPGHGSLGNRVTDLVGLGDAAARAERRVQVGGGQVGSYRATNRLDHTAGRLETASQFFRRGAILPDGEQVAADVGAEFGGDEIRRLVRTSRSNREIGTGVDPMVADDAVSRFRPSWPRRRVSPPGGCSPGPATTDCPARLPGRRPRTAPAAVCNPIPPRAHTGTPKSRVCWSRTNVSVSPTRPPLSQPLAMRPPAPAATAARASAREVISARTRRPGDHRSTVVSKLVSSMRWATVEAPNRMVDTAAGKTEGSDRSVAPIVTRGWTAKGQSVRAVIASTVETTSSSPPNSSTGRAPARARATIKETLGQPDALAGGASSMPRIRSLESLVI